MPYILPWDADTGLNMKTYNEMLSIPDDPTKIITLQKLRRKKQLHQKMIKHYVMKMMRETLGLKDDWSEEMIENMGMEEMLSNLKEDYKSEMLQRQTESKQKREAARVAAMSEVELENYRESKQKTDATRVAAMSKVELENYRESKQKTDVVRVAAMWEVELENYKESKQTREAARVAAMLEVELENIRESKRKTASAKRESESK